jgi:hypothetical protein
VEEDLVLDRVAVVAPSEELVALVLVLLHMVEVELPLLVVQLDQEVEVLVDSFMVVMVWLLAVVLVALLKAAVAADQVGMVAVVLVTTNVVGLNQVAAVAVPAMDAQRTQVSKVQ